MVVNEQKANSLTESPLAKDMLHLYDLFVAGRIPELITLYTDDCVLDFRGHYAPFDHIYKGLSEIEGLCISFGAATIPRKFVPEIVSIDAGRGAVLVRVNVELEMPASGAKVPQFYEWHSWEWDSGKVRKMTAWNENKTEIETYFKTQAQIMWEKLITMFHKGDFNGVISMCPNTRFQVTGSKYNPLAGDRSSKEHFDMFAQLDLEVKSTKWLHVGADYCVQEVKFSKLDFKKTGKSLMGEKPEDFRMIVQGHFKNGTVERFTEVHMPEPQEMCFLAPGK